MHTTEGAWNPWSRVPDIEDAPFAAATRSSLRPLVVSVHTPVLYLHLRHLDRATDIGKPRAMALKEFFEALNLAEERLIPRLAADRLGIDLRCAVNELNWERHISKWRSELTFEEFEEQYIFQLGIVRLVHLALISRPSFDAPVVLFPRDIELSKEIIDMAWELGKIQHGRRVAQRVAMGIGKISSDLPGCFTIELPSRLENNAGHEEASLDVFTQESRKRLANLMKTKHALKLGDRIRRKLHELVYPWKTHFIGYEASPLLDQYFYDLARFQIEMEEGFDSYHYSLEFGGIAFQTYIFALTFVVGDNMRHVAFAEELIKKDRSILLENVLTITSDIDVFVSDMRDAVNFFGSAYESFKPLDMAQARRIFDVLSYGRHCESLMGAPGAPLPLAVQCSDSGFIHCPAGTRAEPVRYLLEALRHHFPRDYDRNQQSRESSLQRAIERVLAQQFEGLDIRKNVKVKLDGKHMTDIDLAVIETATNTVLLCQLKHQDPYGANIHTENIRGARLVKESRQWLEAIQAWQSAKGAIGILQSLGLRKTSASMQVRLLVIAKHFAHPLRKLSSDFDFLYTNWAQLLLAITAPDEGKYPRTVADVLHRLASIPELQSRYEHEAEVETKWKVGKVVFVTRQVEDGSEDRCDR